MLKRISQVSGGSFYAASDTGSIEPLPPYPAERLVTRSETALFDYPALLAIFILAICTEWYLRRRFQLL
jgi:hypothetical protein